MFYSNPGLELKRRASLSQTKVTAVSIGSQSLLTKGQFVPKCIL